MILIALIHLFFKKKIHSKTYLHIFLEISLITSEEDNDEEETKADKNKENEFITYVTDDENKSSNEMSKSNENVSVEESKSKECGEEKSNMEKSENKINEDIIGNSLDNEVKPIEQEKNKKTSLIDRRGGWWKSMVDPELLEDINQSAKLILLFTVLRQCEMIEDKL